AVVMLCEVAAYYKKKNMTLWDAMIAMYEKYGYYKEDITTLTLKGIDGAAQINALMNKARTEVPTAIGDYDVLEVIDYKAGTRTNVKTGEVSPTGLPGSNVFYYVLSDNAWCCVRPSGTEPKIKFYFGVKGTSLADADAKNTHLKEHTMKMFE
ncbi:MAG: phospho-sugar mutase, partial [Agathobacter sp.]